VRRRVLRFVEEHREVLNALVRVDPSLLTQPGSPLAPLISTRAARVFLDFPNKRTYFHAQLKAYVRGYCAAPGGGSHFPSIALPISREHVLLDSKAAFDALRGEAALRGRLEVAYKGEEGIDAGGLSREWYTIVAREMFRPDYGMWRLSEDGVTYQPNPLSAFLKGGDHLEWFKFVGRVLGKAVADGYLLDIHFTRSLYKHLLGLPVTFADVRFIDPEYHKSLSLLLSLGCEALGLEETFSVTVECAPGETQEEPLCPGGRELPVCDANAPAYVALASHHKMTGAITPQCNALLEGFAELIPPSLISIFSPEELELLISGLPTIDLADLRAHTEYGGGYRPTTQVIQWFWAAVESFSEADKARLLMFVTGTSKVPLGGFKDLRGQRGPQKFTIQKMVSGGQDALPASHTCFNSLDLPAYKDYETLRDKLLVACREGGEGFALI
jgi:E3 ubiquitin-protein ligase HUWE1